MKYASVVIDISAGQLDQLYTYRIPEKLEDSLNIGMQVTVPFGRSNRQVNAFVVGIADSCPPGDYQLKEILRVRESSVSAEGQLIQLAVWMKDEYGSTLLQALKTVLPVRRKVKPVERRKISWLLPDDQREDYIQNLDRRSTARRRLLTALCEDGELPYETAVSGLHVSASVISGLAEKGIIQVTGQTSYRNPVTGAAQYSPAVTLNPEQQYIVDEIVKDDESGICGTYLIHGITGSGKTEVYMELIAHVLDTGREAIVLIPEIALTYQTVMRFYRRFGDQVSILNSRMSAGERYDQYLRAEKGEISIMVGPRSALFTPFAHLGLIIIDEEHETSYQSENSPRYHAVDVAVRRAYMAGCGVVLGSATPSMKSYYRCQTGQYRLFTLKSRAVKDAQLPQTEIVDMRRELEDGNQSVISRRLYTLLSDRLDRKEQTLLFLNRRGYSGFLSCRSCGQAVRCPHCDVSMTLHRTGRLVCHYCGYEQPAPRICPSCGSRYMAGFGIGTQKVETVVQEMFPEARILRMDADTTARKGEHEAILSAFADEKADILIGTQMIVKGHDFPKVTLVGVLAADLSLYSSSYDASERTFQLLTQAAGRAGRDRLPGQVVIQTYSPEHYSIQKAAAQDYEGFYAEELPYRQILHFPPVYAMMTVLFMSREEEAAERVSRVCAQLIEEQLTQWNDGKPPELFGPCDAPVSKIRDIYRKNMYIKHQDRQVLVNIKDALETLAPWRNEKTPVYVQYDIQ